MRETTGPSTREPTADLTDEAVLGRRERKKRETWLGLHDAAVALTVENGFENLTVEAICDRADVSLRTFFNYFPCKEDAVLGGSAGFADVVATLAARPADESPIEAVRATYVDHVRQLGSRTDAILTRQRLVQQYDALRARDLARLAEFEARLAEVVGARIGVDPARDPYPALVAAVTMAVLRTSFTRWQASGTRESLPTLVERAFDSVIAGLPAPPPRRARPAQS